jgi:galactokinase/mevalonate kinase-like predicted kinase
LITTLNDVTSDSVGSYSVRITEDVMSTEFVDRVLLYLWLLQKHVTDLRKHALTQFQSEDEVHAIVSQLIEMGDKLKEKMVENNYFHNTYGYLVDDILFAIKGIVEKMPVRCEAMAY